MKINAVQQLNTRYQVPFRANTQSEAKLATQPTADSTQFKKNVSQVQGAEAKALRKVLNFLKPKSANQTKIQHYTDVELDREIAVRRFYL